MQKFNPFYPHLVLYDRIFVPSKIPLAKLWSEECSYKTVSKNAEAAVRKCSSKAVVQRCSVRMVFSEILLNSHENTLARAFLLIKLQAAASSCNFIKKETLAQVFSCNFVKFLRRPFLTEQLWWLLLVLQNRCS